ncbi:MAG: HAD hydrolase-like protein, partial [Candidatus Eremiobacterota bacterium]
MNTDLAIFDLDGVLIDSRGANAEAFAFGIHQLGLPRPDPARVVALIGQPADRMLAELGCPPERLVETFERYVRPRYLECVAEFARPYPGAADLLGRLRSAGFGVAACTSGARNV